MTATPPDSSHTVGSTPSGSDGFPKVKPTARNKPHRSHNIARTPEDFAKDLCDALDGDATEENYYAVRALIQSDGKLIVEQRRAVVEPCLRRWVYWPRLAAELTIWVRLRGSSQRSLSDILLGSLIRDTERVAMFPQPLCTTESRVDGAARRELIEAWLTHLQTKWRDVTSPDSPNHPSDAESTGILPLFSREYAALACLLRENPIPWNHLFQLLEILAEPRKQNPPAASGLRPDYWAFLNQLSRTLEAKTPRKKMRQLVDSSGPAQQQAAQAESKLQSALEMGRREQTRADQFSTQVQTLEGELQAAMAIQATLSRRIEEVLAELERGNNQARAREEYWRISSQNELARALSSVRDRVGHELLEAILTLEGATPDLGMAVRRLRKAQEIIDSLEGAR